MSFDNTNKKSIREPNATNNSEALPTIMVQTELTHIQYETFLAFSNTEIHNKILIFMSKILIMKYLTTYIS